MKANNLKVPKKFKELSYEQKQSIYCSESDCENLMCVDCMFSKKNIEEFREWLKNPENYESK